MSTEKQLWVEVSRGTCHGNDGLRTVSAAFPSGALQRFPGQSGGIARGMVTDNNNHFYPMLDPLTDLT
jgi:hypothetical protein